MKLTITILLALATQFCVCQSFTVQDNFMTLSGNTTGDFSKNTYLDAFSNETITWVLRNFS